MTHSRKYVVRSGPNILSELRGREEIQLIGLVESPVICSRVLKWNFKNVSFSRGPQSQKQSPGAVCALLVTCLRVGGWRGRRPGGATPGQLCLVSCLRTRGPSSHPPRKSSLTGSTCHLQGGGSVSPRSTGACLRLFFVIWWGEEVMRVGAAGFLS